MLDTAALILAIDVGSSSTRTMILDREGEQLAGSFAQEHYQLETTPDGGSTLDPEAMCECIFTCIDNVLHQSDLQGKHIGAVAMDTLVGNVLGVDAQGKAITPIYTWADTRGSELYEAWRGRLAEVGLSPEAYTQRTGCRVHSSYWPIRLLWLEAQDPATYQQVAHWMSLGEYLYLRLFKQRRVSFSVASWSGLFNRHNLAWDDRVLAALHLQPDQLSMLSGQPFNNPVDQADRWPALHDAAWFPAVGDGVASNLGAGCNIPGRVALSVGTSGALRIIVPGTPAQAPDSLFAYRVDESRTLIGGALSNAGNLYAWMQRVLQLPTDGDAIEEKIKQIAPDNHGLTILPFLAGERAPGWNPDAQAVFMGMTFSTTPEQLVRAGLEAIAYRFAQINERLAPLLPSDPVYIASGGAILSSPTWMQIVADVLNAPVYATTNHETTIRGTVFLATGYEPAPHLGQVYLPDATRHTLYMAGLARQKMLYSRLFSQ
ncbi:MAG: gluconokinase [Chloroflexota bacterium]